MFRCVAFTDSRREEWDRFAQARGTIFHTTAFRQILIDSFGYQCGYHAVVDQQDSICALLPLVIGRNLSLKRVGVSLPFANYLDICADSEEALGFAMASIATIQERCQLESVELRLKAQDIRQPNWQAQLQNVTFALPLLGDEEATLAQASASCRNHVRKTYKNDWFAVSFDPANLPDFYKVYVRRMKQLGSPSPAQGFFESFFRHLPENTFLLSVLDKATGQVIGGMLLLASLGDSTLYYPYGANLVEYNHQYLNNFMYWEAARFGMREGLKRLDLGRSPVGSGTYTYKMQWGAKPEQLRYLFYGKGDGQAGPPDRERLHGLIELWKIMPDFITEPIGKKMIRYVMP